MFRVDLPPNEASKMPSWLPVIWKPSRHQLITETGFEPLVSQMRSTLLPAFGLFGFILIVTPDGGTKRWSMENIDALEADEKSGEFEDAATASARKEARCLSAQDKAVASRSALTMRFH